MVMVHKFADKILKGKEKTFYEEGSMIIDGKKFTSGGAFLGINKKTGKYGGILYAYPKTGEVGTWSGKKKIKATFGKEWKSNVGDLRQTVKFKWNGKNFIGTYYKSGSDVIRFKEVK